MNRGYTGVAIHSALIVGLLLSAICPRAAWAEAASAPAAPPASDTDPSVARVAVRLDGQNRLRGTVRDAAGQVAADTSVVLGRGGKPLHRTRTDRHGRFAIGPLVPGQYEIASPDAAAFLQVQPATADSQQAADMVEISRQAMVARGQEPRRTLLHAALITLVIAAAVAIPIAIAADNDDDAS